ncbi:MAG: drgA 1 [Firmicutes bacterium]|nr:drgA 1 [Bacillota bacterium]
MSNDTLKTIKSRRAIRSFGDEQIKDSDLETLLEAARYAPSAMNRQSWHFTVIQNKELLKEMNSVGKKDAIHTAPDFMKEKMKSDTFSFWHGAPTVIIVSGADDNRFTCADCALACQNILLAAESLGINTCWINSGLMLFEGPSGQSFKERLSIPAGYTPLYSVAIGYIKGDKPSAPERKTDVVTYFK